VSNGLINPYRVCNRNKSQYWEDLPNPVIKEKSTVSGDFRRPVPWRLLPYKSGEKITTVSYFQESWNRQGTLMLLIQVKNMKIQPQISFISWIKYKAIGSEFTE
jgi:hypothetical protein